MKRLVLGLLAVALTVLGLTAVTSAPATAACPYTNCVATATNTSGPSVVRKPNRATFQVGVRAAGNVDPSGSVRFTVYREGRKGAVHQVTKTVVGAGGGVSRTTFTTPASLTKGTYRLVFKYTPTGTSTFKASNSSRTLTIR